MNILLLFVHVYMIYIVLVVHIIMIMFFSLKRQQLKMYIDGAEKLKTVSIPKQGWIKTLREYYGMSVRVLAKRIGLAQSRVTAVEQAEVEGALNLDTLKRFANSLNCDLVYVFVPRENPDLFLKQKAEIKANALMKSLESTMTLEDQGISRKELQRHHEALISELLNQPKKIWGKE